MLPIVGMRFISSTLLFQGNLVRYLKLGIREVVKLTTFIGKSSFFKFMNFEQLQF